MTWDDTLDVLDSLEKLSERHGMSYILVVTQKGRENENGEYRVVAKATASFGSAGDVLAIDEALAEVMADAGAEFGLDEDDDLPD